MIICMTLYNSSRAPYIQVFIADFLRSKGEEDREMKLTGIKREKQFYYWVEKQHSKDSKRIGLPTVNPLLSL